MKSLRSNKGFTGIDIGISIIVVFIFVSLIAVLISNYNSRAKELELKAESVYIAIDEIEKIKNQGFNEFKGMHKGTVTDKNGQSMVFQEIPDKEGFYKTVSVEDYSDINENPEIVEDVVKVVTVEISYKIKGEVKNVKLSTILSKEN